MALDTIIDDLWSEFSTLFPNTERHWPDGVMFEWGDARFIITADGTDAAPLRVGVYDIKVDVEVDNGRGGKTLVVDEPELLLELPASWTPARLAEEFDTLTGHDELEWPCVVDFAVGWLGQLVGVDAAGAVTVPLVIKTWSVDHRGLRAEIGPSGWSCNEWVQLSRSGEWSMPVGLLTWQQCDALCRNTSDGLLAAVYNHLRR